MIVQIRADISKPALLQFHVAAPYIGKNESFLKSISKCCVEQKVIPTVIICEPNWP